VRRQRHEREEVGSAGVQTLVLLVALTVVALVAAAAGGVLVGQRRAAAAADLAALAAAGALEPAATPTSACGEAARVSAANEARLVDCRVDGREVEVSVQVDVRSLGGLTRTVPGRARAGPVDAVAAR
jgi:secretion/DNA translocation related TadE-like protein